MNLLIITQKVDKNDPILGFFHSWIIEFSRHYSNVSVVCLESGEYNLPNNVEVYSLGKKDLKPQTSNLKLFAKIKYVVAFLKYIFRNRRKYDEVFVHMNPIYVVLAGVMWRILGKKVGLWYTHREVDLKLRIATKLVNHIFTASEYSFNIKSEKVHIVGHGILADRFTAHTKRSESEVFKVLYVGRLTRIKNLDVLIKATDLLRDKTDKSFIVELIGDAISEDDKKYQKELFEFVREKNLHRFVSFLGAISNEKMPKYYTEADVSVNLSPTGGVDKAVLESLLSGTPAFVSNQAFEDYYGRYWDDLSFKEVDAGDLSDKIAKYINKNEENKITLSSALMKKVQEKSNLENLIVKISSLLRTG